MDSVKGLQKWVGKRMERHYWQQQLKHTVATAAGLAGQAKALGAKGLLLACIKDIICGWKRQEVVYLFLLVGIQLGVYVYQPENFLGMLAGVTGILNVIFVTKGKISNYFFGLINVSIYLYLSVVTGFYGEVLTSIYFFIMQFIGAYLWLMNAEKRDTGATSELYVKSRKLSVAGWVKAIMGMLAIWAIFGYIYRGIGSHRPFRDSVTDGTNYVGQWLMNGSYAAQWLFWIGTNVFSIYLWWGASLEIVVMYWVFLFNSIVGYVQWTKRANQIKQHV